MFEIIIFNSIVNIEKECWNELTENNIYMCYEWLKTSEETTALPFRSYYITAYYKGKIAGATVCYFEERKFEGRSIDDLLFGRCRNFTLLKKLSFLPALICNPKRGYGTHFVFPKGLEADQITALHEELLTTLENIASSHNSAVCFSNVMEHETYLIQLLIKKRYLKTMSLPLNYIDVKWSSFNEYKKYVSKTHPSAGKTISRDININRRSGVVINQMQILNGCQHRLYELLQMNYRKYSDDSFPINKEYFQRVIDNFGNDAVILTAVKESNIFGVLVELRKGKTAALTYIGIDHSTSQKDLTYFNIVFYEPIKRANELGIERIYGGNAFYKMKGRRGYNAACTYIFYKPNHGLFNFLITIWFSIHYLWMSYKFSFAKKNIT